MFPRPLVDGFSKLWLWGKQNLKVEHLIPSSSMLGSYEDYRSWYIHLVVHIHSSLAVDISIWDSSMAQAGPLVNLDLSLFEKYREPEHMTRNIQKDVLFSCRRRYVLLQCHLVGIQMSCDLNLADIWEEASTHSVSIFGRWHKCKIPNWVNGALLDHQGKKKNY